MTDRQVIVRFAPSPTGRLHVGNVRAALINYLFANKCNGKFILRIDDTDAIRSTKEFVEYIKKDLKWLELIWSSEVFQSHRVSRYKNAAEKLKQIGRLYPCYETPEELEVQRKQQIARRLPPIYNRAALKLSDEEKINLENKGITPHWRFLLNNEKITWNDLIYGKLEFESKHMSDPVLIKADGSFVYTLASVVDDIELGITHIIRGADHITNTSVQIQIFRALGSNECSFGHYPLFKTATGKELSKRLGSMSIHELRTQGIQPMVINSLLAKLGTSDAIEPRYSLQELINEFDLNKISLSEPIFNEKDLDLLNHKFFSSLPFNEVKKQIETTDYFTEEFWNLIRGNIESLEDIKKWQEICFGYIQASISEEDKNFLRTAYEELKNNNPSWHDWIAFLKKERSGKKLFMPLRLAITGLEHGPELPCLLSIIGMKKVLNRLEKCI